MRRLSRTAVLCAWTLFLAGAATAAPDLPVQDDIAGPSSIAEPPVSTPPSPAGAVRDWIAAIDATPDWKAGSSAIGTDASGNVVVSGLSIAAEGGSVVLAFDRVTLAGLVIDPANGFSAVSVAVDTGTLQYGAASFALTRVDLAGVVVPALGALAFDASRPFTSLVKAYTALARMKVGGGSIGTLAIIQKMAGIASRIAYENVKIGPLADGRLARLEAGPLTMIAPAPEALAEITVRRAELRDLDLNAFIRVYDPDAYVGGQGDLVWRSAIGHAGYDGFTMDVPGARLSIGSVGVEKFSVRQPPRSFAAYLDRAGGAGEASPESGSDADLASLVAAFGLGRLSVTDLKVDAVGIDALALKSFQVAGLSSDAVAELAIEGFSGAVEGELAIDLGRFAVGGVKLPGAGALVAAAQAAEKGGDIDFSSLAPMLSYVEVAGLDVRTPDLPRVAIGNFRADLGGYLGAIPTSVSVKLAGMDVPTRLLPIRVLAGMLSSFGNDRIIADAMMKMAWNEGTRDVALDDIRLDMKDIGVLDGTARLTGLTREAIEQSGSILSALPGIVFTGATFTFKDNSFIDRGLANRAAAMKVDPEKLRTQLATAIPFMLGFLGNPDFQKQVAPALKGFLLSPGTITATVAPPVPVPVPDIARTLRSAPQTLPALLGISVKGDQPAVPRPTPTKDIRSTLDPVPPAPATAPTPAN